MRFLCGSRSCWWLMAELELTVSPSWPQTPNSPLPADCRDAIIFSSFKDMYTIKYSNSIKIFRVKSLKTEVNLHSSCTSATKIISLSLSQKGLTVMSFSVSCQNLLCIHKLRQHHSVYKPLLLSYTNRIWIPATSVIRGSWWLFSSWFSGCWVFTPCTDTWGFYSAMLT